MAPGSPAKRKSSTTGRAAKKARSTNQIPTVVNAINGCEAVPGDVRALLKQILPGVLKANKEDRHSYEAMVVEEAGHALQTVKADRQKTQKEALAHQNNMISPDEESARKAVKKEAEDKLAHAKETVEDAKGFLKAAEKEEETAQENLKAETKKGSDAVRKATSDGDHAIREAKREDATAGAELKKVTDKHAQATQALAEDFVVLKDGTGSPADSKKALAKLEQLGRQYGLDGTLLGVLPMAAKKAPDARSEFEGMAFSNLHSLITGVIADLDKKVAEATPAKAAKEAAVSAAEQAKADAVSAAENAKNTAVDAAKAALSAAQATTKEKVAELAAAQEDRSEASKELTRRDTNLRHIWEDMRKACDAQDEATLNLKAFDDVLSAFESLKEKKPEEPPAEEPAEAAAQEAAPEA